MSTGMYSNQLRIANIAATSISEIYKYSTDLKMYEQAISILNNYNSKDLEMWVERKLSSIWSNESVRKKYGKKKFPGNIYPDLEKRMKFENIDDFDKLFYLVNENEGTEE
ncbi:hypothetical protein MS3_00004569 [Schistosoma haematobium]|uniref:Uncharacterized protein n=1 Tax=Schistosoma haematobium TaxID=6185 RepID=A0A922LSZ7_SCHHA|nr:hypothetical protein MS3_00004569 [Schistosoma haematobium]KAH9592752.1 hypothetical protein MS3_00004569 [Schistosoma haematobium]CAH8681466.1 unnamed protein product [Schistosoma haematobium]